MSITELPSSVLSRNAKKIHLKKRLLKLKLFVTYRKEEIP